MAAQILYICDKCQKRKDESAFPYKLKACDKCTDATRQYYIGQDNHLLSIKSRKSRMWWNVFYFENGISYQSFIL